LFSQQINVASNETLLVNIVDTFSTTTNTDIRVTIYMDYNGGGSGGGDPFLTQITISEV